MHAIQTDDTSGAVEVKGFAQNLAVQLKKGKTTAEATQLTNVASVTPRRPLAFWQYKALRLNLCLQNGTAVAKRHIPILSIIPELLATDPTKKFSLQAEHIPSGVLVKQLLTTQV